MNTFGNWIQDHALVVALLAASAAGHLCLGLESPQVIVRRWTQEREIGRTSVAVTLVASSQESETTEQKIFEVTKEPAETPVADAIPETIDAPVETTAKPIEPILVADVPGVSEFEAPLLKSPEIKRAEEEPEETPPETTRKPKKKLIAAKPEAELVEANAEVNYITQQSAGVDVPPSARSRPDPNYPARLLPYRIQASVQLLVLIGADGRVKKVTVVKSSGYEDMDQSAVETIRDLWTFDPALKGDQAVEHEVTFPVNFSVRNRRSG
ncbi:MAG: energy transducer TonB [Planctomycetaceae bacterium]|nr:energy transducer TonB [Planctomycetaceae bacterium]